MTSLPTPLMLLVTIGILSLTACRPQTDDNPPPPSEEHFEHGYFILNEGNFQRNNASVSFFSDESQTMESTIFQKVNDLTNLGDVLQSGYIHSNMLFLVVNNSREIIVADKHTLKELHRWSVEGFPRYVTVENGQVYVSVWGNAGEKGRILIYDIDTFNLTETIKVGYGPERLLAANGWLYVPNSGGFDHDKYIHQIDLTTNAVVDSIMTNDNPTQLLIDENGDLWAIGRGYSDFVNPENDTPGFLMKIEAGGIEATYEMDYGVDNLVSYREKLYFTNGDYIYKLDINNDAPPLPWIEQPAYGLQIDTTHQLLLALDAKDYNSLGQLLRYSLEGTLQDEFTTGIIPGEIVITRE